MEAAGVLRVHAARRRAAAGACRARTPSVCGMSEADVAAVRSGSAQSDYIRSQDRDWIQYKRNICLFSTFYDENFHKKVFG